MKLKNSTLLFPKEYVEHKYSLIHFSFFIQYAKISGLNVELVESTDTVFLSDDKLIFSCMIDNKQVIFDYADHHYRNWKSLFDDIPYFKFQTTADTSDGVFSLGPPIVGSKIKGSKGATMREYMQMRKTFDYSPTKKILSKQLPNGAATERRQYVHQMLQDAFGGRVDTDVDCDQWDFWKMHEGALASVCVPGATNNMADRGQTELIGLGVCTISPEIKTIFPYNKKLKPNYHYIKCKDDYSDLVDILNQLSKTPEKAIQIANRARKFYELYYTPESYWKWIIRCLKS